MTATGTLRHEGSTGRRGLSLVWRTILNPGSWIFLHTAPYLLCIENYRVQMKPAQRQRWCLEMMEDISQLHTENSWRFSARNRRRHSRRIGQPTMQLTWSPADNLPSGLIYNLSEFQLRTLRAYIEANLPNGFIQRSSSPAAAPILFAKRTMEG